MHRVNAVGQPLPEEVAIQRPQHQALGPARGGRNDAHVAGQQALLAQTGPGRGAGVDLQGMHGVGDGMDLVKEQASRCKAGAGAA